VYWVDPKKNTKKLRINPSPQKSRILKNSDLYMEMFHCEHEALKELGYNSNYPHIGIIYALIILVALDIIVRFAS